MMSGILHRAHRFHARDNARTTDSGYNRIPVQCFIELITIPEVIAIRKEIFRSESLPKAS